MKGLEPATGYHFRVCGRDGSTPGATRSDCAGTRTFTTPAGNPDVDFQAHPGFPLASFGFTEFDAADFNRDGKLDLAVADVNGLAVRLGDGAGCFGQPTPVPSFGNERTFASGDLNGDARPDLITRTDHPSVIIVRLGDGAGGFSGPFSSVSVDYPPESPVLRDFDRDGDRDLGLIAVDSGNGLTGTRAFPKLLANDGAGHLSLGPPPNFGPGLPLPMAAADVNSDGKLDLVTTVSPAPASSDDTLATALGNGDLTFATPVTSAIGGAGGQLVLGDYNRDGRIDAAVTAAVLTGDGKGGFRSVGQTFPTGFLASHRADFNRDGILDLVGRPNGPFDLGVLLGEGDGTFRTPYGFPGGASLVEDFNRDGKPDILRFDDGGEQASVLLNTTP